MSFDYTVRLAASGQEAVAGALGDVESGLSDMQARTEAAAKVLSESGVPGLAGLGRAAASVAPTLGRVAGGIAGVSAVLGPIGLAISAATVAWSFLSDAIDAVTGATERAAEAQASFVEQTFANISRAIEARAKQMRGDIDDLVAVLGTLQGVNAAQARDARRVAEEQRAIGEAQMETLRRLADATRDLTAADEALAVAQRGTLAATRARVEFDDAAERVRTLQATADSLSETTHALGAEGAALRDAVAVRQVALGIRKEEVQALRATSAAQRDVNDLTQEEADLRNAQLAVDAAMARAAMRRVEEVRTLRETAAALGLTRAEFSAMSAALIALDEQAAARAGASGWVLALATAATEASAAVERLAASAVESLALALEPAGERVRTMTEELLALAESGQTAAAHMARSVTPVLGGIAQGFAGAAVNAALFGGSLKNAVNEVAKAATAQAAIGVLLETAKGFAALAIGSPSAALHFKAAGVFAAVAVAAGVVAAATGGLRSGEAGGASAGALPAPREDFGREERRDGPTQIELSVNFGGQPLHTERDIQVAVARALDGALSGRGSYRMSGEARRALAA